MRSVIAAVAVLLATLAVAQVDTKDGTAITTSTTLDGQTGIDTIDGQAVTAPAASGDWGVTALLGSQTGYNGFGFGLSGTSPASSGMNLSQACLRNQGGTGDVRIAVYQGGSLATGPAGATLIEDLGIISGDSSSSWFCASTGSSPAMAASTVTWIFIKTNDNSLWELKYSTSSGDAGDFQTGQGMWYGDSLDKDETVAYPSTYPADSTGFGGAWYSAYLSYD